MHLLIWQVWLASYLAIIGAMSVLSSIRTCFCPRSARMARWYAIILGVAAGLAALACVVAAWMLSSAEPEAGGKLEVGLPLTQQ